MQLPLRVQLHASGYNVSHAGPKVEDTGHFRLTLERPGQKAEVIELDGGQTEVWLNPPKGDYNARLELVSNTGAGKRDWRAPSRSPSACPERPAARLPSTAAATSAKPAPRSPCVT